MYAHTHLLTVVIYQSYVSNEIVELNGVYLKDRQDLDATLPDSAHGAQQRHEAAAATEGGGSKQP